MSKLERLRSPCYRRRRRQQGKRKKPARLETGQAISLLPTSGSRFASTRNVLATDLQKRRPVCKTGVVLFVLVAGAAARSRPRMISLSHSGARARHLRRAPKLSPSLPRMIDWPKMATLPCKMEVGGASSLPGRFDTAHHHHRHRRGSFETKQKVNSL